MFKGWFSRKPASTTSVFTANWEMSPQDPETFADDLALHAVDAKDLPAVHLALEIRLDAADRIVGVRTWQEGTLRSDQPSYVTERWKPLIGSPFPTPVQTREPKWLVLDEDGPHVLGGPIPDGLHVPRTENPGGLQFVATINPDDNLRSAGEHPLHILCPLLLPNFARLDLDYSDPMAPRIVDEASFHADISLEGLDFEGITDASAITYEGARVSAALACATMAPKASGSWTARSARTLRSTSIPALEAVDEARIGQRFVVRAHGGVDPLDPERAELALARLAVAGRVLVGLVDGLRRRA
jgi:hypothetical protein